MSFIRRVRLKFWRTLAGMKHKYTKKYAKLLGVKVADTTRFTGVPDFCTEPWLVEIGEKCLITQNVHFMTHDGSIYVVRGLGEKYEKVLKYGKIIVEDYVFIGANSMIMPSVRIGAGSVIAACSCVTKDVPPGEVWGGIPAKKICTVQEHADKLYSVCENYDFEKLMSMSKKDYTSIVADIYWKNKHL